MPSMAFLMLILLVSCGKNGSSSGTSSPQQETTRRGHIDTATQGETELLNVTTSEAIVLENDRLTFNRPVSLQDSGMRIKCSFSVNAGDIWHFQRRGNVMDMEMPNGSRYLLKASGSSWIWNGTENGMKVRRRFTILRDRIIINQDCEG